MSARLQINLEGGSQPTAEQCRALVERIAASREFRRAKRHRSFLSYVVDRHLAGRSDEISEVLIGHRVFGRPADYNSGDDSIVRTEARNLRLRLERYFDGEGAAEPVRIEIPRGGYVPIFRFREPAAPAAASSIAPPPPVTRRRWIWMAAPASVAAVVAASRMVPGLRSAGSADAAGSTPAAPGGVQLESSDARLTQAFQHAKERAMGCVYAGDPIGDWYASSPNANAFCMRDLSHESLGASVLGLTRHTANMLRRFALSIGHDRKWCGYWLINKDGFPSPQSYFSDADFGYCLPASLDLVRACYRQFLWTGDRAYLDATFSFFYEHTVTSYVAAWDKDHAGFMKANPERKRINGSYVQGQRFQTGADLVAAQYAAYCAYAAIQDLKGAPGSLSARRAAEMRSQAEAFRARFNAEWWNPALNRFYSGMNFDGAFDPEYVDQPNVYGLWFGIPEDGVKTEASLDAMEASRPKYDSNYSYFPEVLYRYGRNQSAYKFLLEIADPGFSGYGLTETAFAVVGAIAAGLMGLAPDAPHQTVETLPRLAAETAWARLSRVPVMQNEIAIEHRGGARDKLHESVRSAAALESKFRGDGTRAHPPGRGVGAGHDGAPSRRAVSDLCHGAGRAGANARRPGGWAKPLEVRMIKPRELESDSGRDVWDMILAAATGDTPTIRRLVDSDPELIESGYFYTPAIHFAVREGHLDAVQTLLEAGADPEWNAYHDGSLIEMARDRGHDAIAHILDDARRRRARVVPAEVRSDHPIHLAAEADDVERVRELLDTDATLLDRGDATGGTPLHRAVMRSARRVIALLCDRGADIHAIHGVARGAGAGWWPEDVRAIDLAIWGGPRLRGRDFETARLLLARGADYHLTIAAALGDVDRVTALLDQDPNCIREASPNGRRALSAAVQFGHGAIARLLLERGADPSWPEKDASKGAALHAAARAGDRELVELLLAHGADPSSHVDSAGNAVYAAKTPELRALLMARGGTVDPYDLVWMDEDDEVIRRVTEDPSSAELGCGGVFTAVCTRGKRDLLMRLLDAGIRVPAVVTGCRSYLLENVEMLRILLASGMNPDMPNWQRQTFLHDLCKGGKRSQTEEALARAGILLDAGAAISAREEEYRSTPLAWASRTNMPDMVEFLLARGAPTNLPDDPQWATPLAWAERRGHAEVAEILRKHGAVR